ncbi:MAG: hypothetical protein U0235_28740 [Polyangiaceae bacterium]
MADMPIFEISESDLDQVTGGRVEGPALDVYCEPLPWQEPPPPYPGDRWDYSAPVDQLY